MDKDRVAGKLKDIKGRIERHVGEWTGDKDAQAFGKIKDAGREALNQTERLNKTERKNDAPGDEDRNRNRNEDEDVA